MSFNQLYQRARNFGESVADFLKGFAQLKDETRVDRILAGSAIVDEGGSLLVVLGDERCELLDHRDSDVPGKRAFASQLLDREQIRIALRLNRCGGFFGRDALASQRSCQSGFEIEHGLQAAMIGKDLAHIVGREKWTEQVDGVWCGHLSGASAGIISREVPLRGEKQGGRKTANGWILLRFENA